MDSVSVQCDTSMLTKGTKSYPTQERLCNDCRLLTFHTGLLSMTVSVSMAVFNPEIPQSVNNKLTHFEWFMLDIMSQLE